MSEIRFVDGDEAIAVKPAAVLNESSLIMSKPTRPGLATCPVICMLMYEVGIEFHLLSEFCSSVVALARDRNAGPSGLGIGLSVLFILYDTGIDRASQRIPITRARI